MHISGLTHQNGDFLGTLSLQYNYGDYIVNYKSTKFNSLRLRDHFPDCAMRALPTANPVMRALPTANPVMRALPTANPVMRALPTANPVILLYKMLNFIR